YQPGPYDWQINRKLNLQLVPEWDGHGKTAIVYICKIAELVRLSPQMIVDLGATAPLKFTGRAEMWWQTQSTPVRAFLSQSWSHLLQAIQAHFLNANWLQERRREWEEMRFRQRGHENEYPLDFVQRRIVYAVFLYPEEADGVIVVDRILQTAPPAWAGTINSERYPDIFSLAAAVRRYRPTLMGDWIQAQQLGNTKNYYPRRSERTAHAADLSDASGESEEDGPAPPRAAHAAEFRRQPPRTPAKKSERRNDWPEGKTVKGYEFNRRDDVHSARPPTNGACYICISPNHFARDCPHYGKWLSFRDTNMVHVDVAYDREEADYNEYVAMMSEVINEPSSLYLRENYKPSTSYIQKQAHLAYHVPSREIEASHRNARRREQFESTPKGKSKMPAVEESSMSRRAFRAHGR
ncbi:hypothetical protein C8R46DRAFT_875594, partial [Mycena filopes]